MINAPEWVRQLVDSVAEATTSINSEGELVVYRSSIFG